MISGLLVLDDKAWFSIDLEQNKVGGQISGKKEPTVTPKKRKERALPLTESRARPEFEAMRSELSIYWKRLRRPYP
jgi:hypothetical protein